MHHRCLEMNLEHTTLIVLAQPCPLFAVLSQEASLPSWDPLLLMPTALSISLSTMSRTQLLVPLPRSYLLLSPTRMENTNLTSPISTMLESPPLLSQMPTSHSSLLTLPAIISSTIATPTLSNSSLTRPLLLPLRTYKLCSQCNTDFILMMVSIATPVQLTLLIAPVFRKTLPPTTAAIALATTG